MAIVMKMAWKPSAISANIPPLVTLTPGGNRSSAIFSSMSTPNALRVIHNDVAGDAGRTHAVCAADRYRTLPDDWFGEVP